MSGWRLCSAHAQQNLHGGSDIICNGENLNGAAHDVAPEPWVERAKQRQHLLMLVPEQAIAAWHLDYAAVITPSSHHLTKINAVSVYELNEGRLTSVPCWRRLRPAPLWHWEILSVNPSKCGSSVAD
jgi:hypothetical protein